MRLRHTVVSIMQFIQCYTGNCLPPWLHSRLSWPKSSHYKVCIAFQATIHIHKRFLASPESQWSTLQVSNQSQRVETLELSVNLWPAHSNIHLIKEQETANGRNSLLIYNKRRRLLSQSNLKIHSTCSLFHLSLADWKGRWTITTAWSNYYSHHQARSARTTLVIMLPSTPVLTEQHFPSQLSPSHTVNVTAHLTNHIYIHSTHQISRIIASLKSTAQQLNDSPKHKTTLAKHISWLHWHIVSNGFQEQAFN